MSGLARRVARLEEQVAPDPDDPLGLRKLSDEELRIQLRDECIAFLAANSTLSAEDRAALEDCVVAVEQKIRKAAESQVRYPDHYRWKAECWNSGPLVGLAEYVPPIADHNDVPPPGKREDAEMVATMRWRAEMRTRPDIAALIAEGSVLTRLRAESLAGERRLYESFRQFHRGTQ